MEQRTLFKERLSTQHAEANLVCCSILQPFECIPPEVMSRIYKLLRIWKKAAAYVTDINIFGEVLA
jgi:hypothetical protein